MKKLFLYISLLLLFATDGFAGMPVGKGRTIFGLGYTYLYSKKTYDSKWQLNDPLYPATFFKSNNYTFFLDHGMSRRVDFICNFSYLNDIVSQNGIISKRSDFGDAMAGFAYNLENKDYTKYLTFQASLILPMYTNPVGELAMGYAAPGVDLTVSSNIIPKFLNNSGSMMFQLSYRDYFTEEGPQQLIGGGSIDFVIKHINQIAFNFQGIASFSRDTTSNINLKGVKDFVTGNFTASYTRRITRTMMVSASAFYTLFGRNTSKGMGFGASVIFRVP